MLKIKYLKPWDIFFYLKYEFIYAIQSLRASHPVNLKINCFPGILLGFESNQSWLYYYFLVRKYFSFLHRLILPFTSFTPVVCNFYIVRSSSAKVPLLQEFMCSQLAVVVSFQNSLKFASINSQDVTGLECILYDFSGFYKIIDNSVLLHT